MKFILYRDRKKEYRWKLVARNGRSIAVSGEGYKRKAGALKAIHLLKLMDIRIVWIEGA